MDLYKVQVIGQKSVTMNKRELQEQFGDKIKTHILAREFVTGVDLYDQYGIPTVSIVKEAKS